MKRLRRERGSAMVVAIIITIVVVGLGGAFLTQTVYYGKQQKSLMRADEAQIICDAGLEMTRLCIKEWRNSDPLCLSLPALPATSYAWNQVFDYCAQNDLTHKNADGIITSDPDALKANYLALIQKHGTKFDPSVATPGSVVPSYAPGGPLPLSQLFCIWRTHGNGAYWVQMKNNDDVHGDGKDDDRDGDSWNYETGDLANGAGTHSNLIDGDRQAIVVVTACLPDGTLRQIEALVEYPSRRFSPSAALIDNGTIAMKGSYSILGTMGIVQANGDLIPVGGSESSGSSSSIISVSAGASGSAESFKANFGGTIGSDGIKSGASPAPIPAIDDVHALLTAPELAAFTADIVWLKEDGNAYDSKGNSIGKASAYGFSYSAPGQRAAPGGWELSGHSMPPNKIYLLEGDYRETDGGPKRGVNLTLITTGSIVLRGNASINSYPGSGVALIAGGDVDLGGTSPATYNGTIYAVEQISLTGNVTVNGAVIGENLRDSHGEVTSSRKTGDDAQLNGNAKINYSGQGTFLPMPAQSVAVRSVRCLK